MAAGLIVSRLQLRLPHGTLRKLQRKQWSFPVAVGPARCGIWKAGSLGQVRQEPLNPCRESRREQAIA